MCSALYLNNNNLTGTINASFASLSALVELDLSYNRLSGTIPPSTSTLDQLTYLNLANNMFTGASRSTGNDNRSRPGSRVPVLYY